MSFNVIWTAAVCMPKAVYMQNQSILFSVQLTVYIHISYILHSGPSICLPLRLVIDNIQHKNSQECNQQDTMSPVNWCSYHNMYVCKMSQGRNACGFCGFMKAHIYFKIFIWKNTQLFVWSMALQIWKFYIVYFHIICTTIMLFSPQNYSCIQHTCEAFYQKQ